jgi:hypothetical protein
MPQASLKAFVRSYRAQIDWLLAQAEEFDSGQRKVTGRVAGKEVDVSQAYANEYRHKAGNLEAVLQAFERLHAEELAGLSR